MGTGRILELDLLRGIAILMVLLAHTADYIGDNAFLDYGLHGFIVIGLGAFAFLTGYGLEHGRLTKGKDTLRRYAKRRLWRVYVPYLVALVLFLLVFDIGQIHKPLRFSTFSPVTVIHILGLQGLIFPHAPQAFTLWYIGLLLPMYASYPLMVRKESLGYLFKATAAIFAIALLIRISLNFIDIRFFSYFPFFPLGVYIRRTRSLMPLLNRPYWGIAALVGFIALYATYMEFWGDFLIYDRWKGMRTLSFTVPILLTYLLMALALIASLGLLRYLVITPKLQWLSKSLLYIASGAYFIYLFHRPILALFYLVTQEWLSLPPEVVTGLYFLASAGMIWLCHWAEQVYVNRVYTPRLSSRRRELKV